MDKLTVSQKIIIAVLGLVVLIYWYDKTDYAREQKFFRCIEAVGCNKFVIRVCHDYFKDESK